MVIRRLILLLSLQVFLYIQVNAQHTRKFSLRDSLDGAVDLSDWIINAHGFVPVPYPITEPALGYGAAIVPVLISPRKQRTGKYAHLAPSPPTITGAAVMYTSSKSWAVGAGRTGSIEKWNLRYAITAAYTNMNLSYYKTILNKEQELDLNIEMIPAFLRLKKRIGYSNFHGGVQYFFAKTKAKLRNTPHLDSLLGPKELENTSSIPGILVEYDSRDNTFTPNKGVKAHINANWSDHIFGSDYDYVKMNGFGYAYLEFSPAWVCGFRGDMQQVIGDVPIYFLPSIDLRGIPKGRYQGKTNVLVETEQRWNVTKRWSAVFFGGTGKAFDQYSDFGSSQWVYNFGTGFRYKLARKLGLYMGADIARGPEQYGFYIQFGNAWMK
ncbi:BamA/TamA family outer membrane protein [Chitinophaga barathri]|uniref:Uncharacterized protein n=1 Tax=Chitinophaga barathri TaxID=1647451 RepID=A0A3N4MG65_9BACT|nr:BamA/TamA family outer membrane protein [Chitinophaga barathri]RPD40687.1 hypothetical protein EG028_11660 [Chitinophaga barathri]